ncbi:hypothetical protein PR048_013768 [Dryococelus australis]|uniref:Uncharacterized protein n=1 Tax=Dryococelus australis TaxID=614101 RepID=A0ABQ9HT32_9NEOP|nr:hypothetical protein PR048_013768 [Dryococelus australis]
MPVGYRSIAWEEIFSRHSGVSVKYSNELSELYSVIHKKEYLIGTISTRKYSGREPASNDRRVKLPSLRRVHARIKLLAAVLMVIVQDQPRAGAYSVAHWPCEAVGTGIESDWRTHVAEHSLLVGPPPTHFNLVLSADNYMIFSKGYTETQSEMTRNGAYSVKAKYHSFGFRGRTMPSLYDDFSATANQKIIVSELRIRESVAYSENSSYICLENSATGQQKFETPFADQRLRGEWRDLGGVRNSAGMKKRRGTGEPRENLLTSGTIPICENPGATSLLTRFAEVGGNSEVHTFYAHRPCKLAFCRARLRARHKSDICYPSLTPVWFGPLKENIQNITSFSDTGRYKSKDVHHSLQTVRLLASHLGEPGSIPGRVTAASSKVGIVLDSAVDWHVFSGISCFPRLCIPALLHFHLDSHSSALKTSCRTLHVRKPFANQRLVGKIYDIPWRPSVIYGRTYDGRTLRGIVNPAVFYLPAVASCSRVRQNGHFKSVAQPTSMERCRNEGAGETGDPRENPPTNGIDRHDSHIRKSGDQAGVGGERANLSATTAPRQSAEHALVSRDEKLAKRDRVACEGADLEVASAWFAHVNLLIRTDPSLAEKHCRLTPSQRINRYPARFFQADKINFKHVYTEVTFAVGSAFIMHTLGDTEPKVDLQGNKKRIPYCLVRGNTRAAANEQISKARLYKGLPARRHAPSPVPPGLSLNWLHTQAASNGEIAQARKYILAWSPAHRSFKTSVNGSEFTWVYRLKKLSRFYNVAMQWRVVKRCKQEPVTGVEPGESECTAATHETAARHPLHTCCDVNCTTTFNSLMCKLAKA